VPSLEEGTAVLAAVSEENGFYHGKISSVRFGKRGVSSFQSLLSPQLAADTYAPIFSFPSKIQLPVLVKNTLNIAPYIFDVS
jgi:hypothetical protein